MRRGWAVLALWLGAAAGADLGALSCYGVLRLFRSYGWVGMPADLWTPDAVMTYAPAGKYEGPAAISEYIAVKGRDSLFVNRSFSPLFRGWFEGWDAAAGACKFLTMSLYAPELRREVGGLRFIMAQMMRLSYRPSSNQLAEAHFHFDTKGFGAMTAPLGGTEGRKVVCGVMQSSCNATWDRNGLTSISECVERLGALPVTEGPAHHVDGNSSGCRALHASMAAKNPVHCPHISLNPEVDANGKLKCHKGGKYPAGDGFSQDDLSAFAAFAESQGIPEAGYKYLSEEEFARVASSGTDVEMDWGSLLGLEDSNDSSSSSSLVVLVAVVVAAVCLLLAALVVGGLVYLWVRSQQPALEQSEKPASPHEITIGNHISGAPVQEGQAARDPKSPCSGAVFSPNPIAEVAWSLNHGTCGPQV